MVMLRSSPFVCPWLLHKGGNGCFQYTLGYIWGSAARGRAVRRFSVNHPRVLPSNFARRPRPKSRTGRVNWRRRHALDAAVPGRGKCVAPEKRPQVGRTSRRPGYSFLPTTRAADHARSPEWTALEARRPCGSFEPLAAAGGCFGTSGRRAQFGALSSSQNACLELRSDFSLRVGPFSPQKRYL